MRLFLDLDNTVTESRGPIAPEMFDTLIKFGEVVIVSGASKEQMRSQIGNLPCILLAQNGNDNPLWKRELYEDEKDFIREHLGKLVNNGAEYLEDRHCQMSYSFTGHHAPREIKLAYDPDGSKRRAFIESRPPLNERIEVRIGGTTCLDYMPAGLNKGTNIERFIREMTWQPYECVYIGDALFPGGNDETVIGKIPTLPVKNWRETLQFLT